MVFKDIKSQFKSNSFELIIRDKKLVSSKLFDLLKKEDTVYHVQAAEGVSTEKLLAEINKNNQILGFKEHTASMEEIFIQAVENA